MPQPEPTTEYARLWREFETWENKAAKNGSGMTQSQMTGASMMLSWLLSDPYRQEARSDSDQLREIAERGVAARSYTFKGRTAYRDEQTRVDAEYLEATKVRELHSERKKENPDAKS